MNEYEKRELREIKRALKRAGNKSRRRHFQKDLLDNPEEAHHSEYDFGQKSSAAFNGLDTNAKKRRKNRSVTE